jgi:hypothetical protein
MWPRWCWRTRSGCGRSAPPRSRPTSSTHGCWPSCWPPGWSRRRGLRLPASGDRRAQAANARAGRRRARRKSGPKDETVWAPTAQHQAERRVIEQAEIAYRRLVTDWQATGPRWVRARHRSAHLQGPRRARPRGRPQAPDARTRISLPSRDQSGSSPARSVQGATRRSPLPSALTTKIACPWRGLAVPFMRTKTIRRPSGDRCGSTSSAVFVFGSVTRRSSSRRSRSRRSRRGRARDWASGGRTCG